VSSPVHVAHLTPTFFHPTSVVGGGDRYPMELAAAQRRLGIDAQVFTYGPRDEVLDYNGVPVNVRRIRAVVKGNKVNPLGDAPWRAARFSEVVHCYQEHTFSTNVGVTLARVLGRQAWVTDLGGKGLAPSRYFDLGRLVTGYMPISSYAAEEHRRWSARSVTIGAGVDLKRFVPSYLSPKGYVLFVGRILPLKGIDYLVEALPAGMELVVAGEPYDERYLSYLREIAAGKDVVFRHGVSDSDLLQLYRDALVTVLPSVPRDRWGGINHRAQLSALTVMEANASGRPAVATAIEAIPEILHDGENGFLVPPNDAPALRRALERLRDEPDLAKRMGEAGRALVEKDFSWDAVARRSLAAYEAAHA